jgi:hypothetical protein
MSVGISSARIQLHFNLHEPIELMDLTMSFQALAFEYRKHLFDHVRSRGGEPNEGDVKLFLTKIENNCILAELGGAVAILGTLFNLMDYVNIFVDFTHRIKVGIDYFKVIGATGDADPKEIHYSKAECGRFADLLDVVAKNKEGDLGIKVIEYTDGREGAKLHLKVSFSSEEAYTARKGALIAQKALEYKGEADHRSVLMYFYQTNTDEPKATGRTGNKAIIKSISQKPLPVYFVSEMDQQRIMYTLADPKINPFKASLIVDVNVETDRNEIPRFYRIVNVHEIIPSDEDESEKS